MAAAAPRRRRVPLFFRHVTARDRFTVGDDRSINLDPVAGAQGGVEFDQTTENADLLRREVDVRKLLEHARPLNRFLYAGFVGDFEREPELLPGFGIGDTNLHDFFLGLRALRHSAVHDPCQTPTARRRPLSRHGLTAHAPKTGSAGERQCHKSGK